MKYFVTGGLGVVGSQFSVEMLNAGHDVVILDACEEPRNLWTLHQLKTAYGNVRVRSERMETADLDETLECDGILHAAAFTGIPQSAKNPNDDWVSNVDATRHLLETLRLAKEKGKTVPPLVALSSVKPYKVDHVQVDDSLPSDSLPGDSLPGDSLPGDSLPGDSLPGDSLPSMRYCWSLHQTQIGFTNPYGFDETTPLSPDEPYAASKMAQSALCMAYGKSYDLPITVFRCSNLYGAAPCHGPRHGWLTWFCISAVLGRPLQRQGTGMQVRDMLFSSDITSAVLAAFQLNCRGAVFNLGGGFTNSISVNEAIAHIGRLVPKMTVVNSEGRQHEDKIFIANTDKFSRASRWEPKVGVHEGIKRICAWAEQYKEDLAKIYEGV